MPTTRRKSPIPSPTAATPSGVTATRNAVAQLARDVEKAVANLPAPIEGGEEPRAFPIFEEVPPGHFMMEIKGTAYEPHLQDGEWVVIDTMARDIVFGEVYAVHQSRGPHLWQITRFVEGKFRRRSHPERPCAWLSPLNHGRRDANGRVLSINLSDGPMFLDCLETDILGRVVGIIDPDARCMRKMRAAMLRRAEEERGEAEARKRGGLKGGAR